MEGTVAVDNCIRSAHAGGQISADERDALIAMHKTLLDHYGNADAAKAAMVEELVARHMNQKRQALISAAVRTKAEAWMTGYRNARGEPDPAAALVHLLEHNGQVRMPKGMSSVVGRQKALLGLAMGKLEQMLWDYRRTWITGTTPDTAELKNVVREARGENTGDVKAKALAAAWMDTADWLRRIFNEAGGAIADLRNWGLPQVHDRVALLAAGGKRGAAAMQHWIADITPRLDLAAMKNHLTGKPLTPAELADSLEWIWKNITTEGWHEREPSAQRTGLGKMANRRAEHRYLVFKSADDWLAYNLDYGGGTDPLTAMMSHVKDMTEDIAAMQVLGPNPDAMLTYLGNFVQRQAALKVAGAAVAVFPSRIGYLGRRAGGPKESWLSTVNAEDYARDRINLARDMWELYRGGPGVVDERWQAIFGTVRNLNVASKLGSATISAITDAGFQQMGRLFAGLPVLRYFDQYAGQFKGGNRREALAAGIILDTAIQRLHREARWSGGMDGPAWSQVLADRTIAWSGLSAHTQAGRNIFGLAFMAELKNRAGDDFAALPPALRRTMERYGLAAADWDVLRADRSHQHLIRPTDIHNTQAAAGRADGRLAERYLEMILMETEYATPNGTLQNQARAYGGLERGTALGEARRSMMQFKMFGLSVISLQLERMVTNGIENGAIRGAGFAAGLILTTTLYGALSVQLKEIAFGKDPRPMWGEQKDIAKFWGAALLQGGGLGIFGDFLASETNRTGGGFAKTVLGPTGDVASSLLALTHGNVAEFVRGEKTNAGRELVRVLQSNTPGGSLWYLKAGYQRVILENLQRQVDPEAWRAFQRRVQQQRKDYGNEHWWRPGEPVPDRWPDMSGVVGR